MKFGTLKFGEQCPRHPAPNPRNVNSAGVLSEGVRAESDVVARNRRSGDWAVWGQPRPASATSTVAAPAGRPAPVTTDPLPTRLALSSAGQPAFASYGSPAAELLVPPAAASRPLTADEKRERDAPPRPGTPVYLQPAQAVTMPANRMGQSRPTATSSVDDLAAAETVVDALIAKIAQKAAEKANFNASVELRARALQSWMLRVAKGDMITRDNLETTVNVMMGVQLRPTALDALFARLDAEGARAVTFRDASRILVGAHVPPRSIPEVRVTLDQVRAKLVERYPPGKGVSEMRRAFAIMDRDRSGALNAAELIRFLSVLGLNLTSADGDILVAALDRNRDGTVAMAEFCRAARGPMPERRARLVLQAFAVLDTDKNKVLTMDELVHRFDSSRHPDVLSGRKTPEDIVADFIAPWDTRLDGKRDGKVDQAEFLDYYDDISATIDDDEYFELMIRNCWHMSGGTGAAQNTTCRRVLVTFTDKTQKVIEIVDDLGMKFDNVNAVRKRLEAQGVTGILTVSLK